MHLATVKKSTGSDEKDLVYMRVNNNDNEQSISPTSTPSIDNNVYVVWQDDAPGDDYDIFFAVSNDNGQTFSTPESISNNA